MKEVRYGLWFWAVVLVSAYPLTATAQFGNPVRVESGLLSGGPASEAGVNVYKGIPFAAPPVGELRWQPPQPPEAWEGVREAVQFAPGCVQNMAGSRLPWTEEFMHQGEVSEDCLYLNVWTAAESADDARPVLVYIHGGGFTEGSGSVAVYDGETLAQKGLVVVTINYRLGLFGFFAHPELTAESEHDASGNYGLLDQVAALRWVRDNIAAFGGDPGNVTIAGQSAGAMSVYLLTASPLAKGLFHRAIVQSGPGGLATFGITSARGLAGPLEEAEQMGVALAEAKGATSLQALRAMPVADLTAPVEGSPPLRFRTVVDGWFLPDDVGTIYAESRQNDVPMMSGMTADEASAFPGYGTMTAEAFQKQARDRYGEQADALLALYSAASDEEAAKAQVQSGRDLSVVALRRLVAARAQTAQTKAYLYYFERGIPWPEHPQFGAFHTGEVPYVFGTLDKLDRPWEPVDRQLADMVTSYWVNFATHGDPNGADLPPWPAYAEDPAAIMVLGENTGPRIMPSEEKRLLFEQLLQAAAQ